MSTIQAHPNIFGEPEVAPPPVIIVDADGQPIPLVIGTPAVIPTAASGNEADTTSTVNLDLKSVFSLKTRFSKRTQKVEWEWVKPEAWITWLAQLRRAESEEVRLLRKQVEQEEIKRYMDNFNKHVDYLKLDNPKRKPPPETLQPGESIPPPRPIDFRRKKPISVKVDEADTIKDAEIKEAEDKEVIEVARAKEELGMAQGRKEKELKDGEDIDWFAYWLANATYQLNLRIYKTVKPTPKPVPPIPFTVNRLKSAGSRLYVAARPPWTNFAMMMGGVMMWDNPRKTGKWMAVYLALTATSTFLPFFCGLLLYYLLAPRIFEASAEEMQKKSLEHVQREAEAEKHASRMDDDDDGSDSESEDEPDDPNRDVTGHTGLAAKLEHVTEKIKRRGRKKFGKTNIGGKLQILDAWDTFKFEHGATIVLVLNDLADMHEKAINLFTWKRPEASVKVALALAAMIPGVYLIPAWVMVKIIELAIFAVFFLVIPIVARFDYYEPNAWMLGGAPTDAEHASELIRKYGLEGRVNSSIASGKPFSGKKTAGEPTSPTTASTGLLNTEPELVLSDDKSTGGMSKAAELLESSRAYLKGEKKLDIALVKRDDDQAETTSLDEATSPKRLALGGVGSLLLRKKVKPTAYSADSTTFLAHYRGSTGTMFISSTGVRYAPFLGGKKGKRGKRESDDEEELEYPVGNSDDEGELEDTELVGSESGVEVVGHEVEIPMTEISGLKKLQKTVLGVKMASGIEIEVISDETFAFTYVANRDQAFNLLVASSRAAIQSVDHGLVAQGLIGLTT